MALVCLAASVSEWFNAFPGICTRAQRSDGTKMLWEKERWTILGIWPPRPSPTHPRSGSIDRSPTSNPKRPPLLLILVTGALSGAGIVFPDKSYVSPGPRASGTSYGSAKTAKKRKRKRWKVRNWDSALRSENSREFLTQGKNIRYACELARWSVDWGTLQGPLSQRWSSCELHCLLLMT
jgi:hypothetical protein